MTNVTYGRSGWVRIDDPNMLGPATLYMQLTDRGMTSLYLDGGSREIIAPMLRRLPLARYRAQAATRPDLQLAMHRSGPAPTDVLSAVQAAFGDEPRRTEKRERERFILKPPVDGLTDDFLRDVGRAYIEAVAAGEKPNITLAEQTGHPKRSVERWVYLARKAGHLPPANRGESR